MEQSCIYEIFKYFISFIIHILQFLQDNHIYVM